MIAGSFARKAPRWTGSLLLLATLVVACSGKGKNELGSSGAGSSGAGSSSSGGSLSGTSSADAAGLGRGLGACDLAHALRGGTGCHFLVGLGNDLDPSFNHNNDGAYTLGTTLDLHYAYLTNLPTRGGWPDWNANGSFVNILTDTAASHGATPMFTLYAMASLGDGNFAMTTNDSAMSLYWQAAKLLFQRLAMFGKPAVVHLEPDFWAYATQKSPDGTAPVIVTAHAPDCAGMPDNLVGMAGCLTKLARTYAPQVAIGFHASVWGGSLAQVIAFFKAIHADQADFIATDVLDRDAGCFEAHVDPGCMRRGSGWYWDETNQTSPNFHEHLAWVTSLHQALNLPVMWWQVPLGVPSSTPGGTASHYRDNRVHYIFNHIDEFVGAGGLGAVFGTGATNQTSITSDNGQFAGAATQYFRNPVSLP